ncbi:MAG: hypothetical protein JNK67_24960 [Alphaproteobacteria bacterium]|nr:hypothetical protein [Alphaproteobacteria bacterium]
MRTTRMMWTTVATLLPLLGGAVAAAASSSEWLSLCSKCLSPAIFSKSGIDTANATAQARITREDAAAWCENWEPQTPRQQCVRLQMSSDDAKKVHRATADCVAGRITPVDGQSYTLAGYWTSDVGRGRSRWRDARGRIVGQDNASNGLAISQQWEILCPARSRNTGAAASSPGGAKAAAPAAAKAPPSTLTPEYRIGQVVEAKYGREWVRARVTGIREARRPDGSRLEYDVSLDNGRRGIVPAAMLRAVP